MTLNSFICGKISQCLRTILSEEIGVFADSLVRKRARLYIICHCRCIEKDSKMEKKNLEKKEEIILPFLLD